MDIPLLIVAEDVGLRHPIHEGPERKNRLIVCHCSGVILGALPIRHAEMENFEAIFAILKFEIGTHQDLVRISL